MAEKLENCQEVPFW